jgi:hypothetical protein
MFFLIDAKAGVRGVFPGSRGLLSSRAIPLRLNCEVLLIWISPRGGEAAIIYRDVV